MTQEEGTEDKNELTEDSGLTGGEQDEAVSSSESEMESDEDEGLDEEEIKKSDVKKEKVCTLYCHGP